MVGILTKAAVRTRRQYLHEGSGPPVELLPVPISVAVVVAVAVASVLVAVVVERAVNE